MARSSGDTRPGFTLIELLFSMAIMGTLTTIAVPQGLRALDDFRTRAAARYLAQRVLEARFRSITHSVTSGLRFESSSIDYLITSVEDGNGNGLRTTEILRGVDRTITPPERLDAQFSGVAFGILDGVPDADGGPAPGSDGVRLGVSTILSLNADGTATSGTLYVHGRGRAQYAVRVLGVTARVRVLKFDFVTGRWVDA
ncbi:MAG TPA: type II secretion system protein [Vicinamibacterales bacterium]|jgi:prepilin-type N-terminal cleavage/methylation domain-containing protein